MNRRPLLLALALALLLLAGAGAWLLLRPAPRQAESAPVALGSTLPGAESSALDAQSGPAGLAGRKSGKLAIPVGVRLPGPGKLEGRVIDRETGLGVPRARVDLLPVPPAASEFMGRMLLMNAQTAHMAGRVKPVAVAETDSTGAFRFEGVRTGTWFLDARGPYYVPETTVRARVLASGEGGPLEVYVFGGGRVLGSVFGPEGQPAPRAKIVLVPGPGNFLTTLQNGDHRLIEAEADAQGAFVFEGVPPGDGWELTASGAGFALSHATGLHIVAGTDTVADVHARAGGTLSGRVLSGAGKADAEKQDEPKPLADAHLGAIPRGLRDLRCAEEILLQTHCVSGPDGSYRMEHVPPGEVDVVAIAWGHLPAIGARVISVDAAQSSANDIVLARGPVVSGRVVDGEGQPIAGVRMSWNLVDWKNFQFDFSFAPMMAAAVKGIELPATGPDGVFHAGPVAGDAPWKIDFQKLGLVDASLSFDPEKDGDPAASNVTVVMHRGGALEGIVIDELAAEPVTTFTISTSDRVDTEEEAPGGRNPFSGGTTFEDPGGRFRIDSLKPGTVQLTVGAPGYPDTKIDDVVISEDGVKKGLIVRLKPGATIRGQVLDRDGKPVGGAQIVVVPEGGRLRAAPGVREANRRERRRNGGRNGPFGGGGMLGNSDELPPGMLGFAANLGLLGDRTAVSRRDGSFEIRGAEPGSARLQAFQREYAWGGSEPLELAAGKTSEGVLVRMHTGGGLEGNVTDRHGRPLAQAIVAAFSPGAFGGGSASSGGLYQGETDAKGDYTIRHVTAGSYFVVVTRGDAALNPLSFFGTLNFDLVSVPEDDMVRYDLVDSSAGGCHVHGRVSDQGQPVTRGMLAAMRFDGDSVLGFEMKAAPLDPQGRYEFAGLAPGVYQLNLDGQGGQIRMNLEVPDVPELELDLELPHGGIEGLVLDDATNEPIAGAEVLLNSTEKPAQGGGLLGGLMGRENRGQRRNSDERGRFQFERLRTAEYEIVVRSPREKSLRGSYAPSAPRRIQVDERRTERNVELRLQAALTLKGVVKDAAGLPVKDASVVATPEGGAASLSERAQSGEDGSYEVRGLAPGNYTVSASAREFAEFEKKGVELKRVAGRENELDIALQKGVLVRVRIVDAAGRPVAGAFAQLVPKSGRTAGGAGAQRILNSLFQGEGNSGDDGLLELGRFAPGEYRLEAQRGLSKAAKDPVKVEGGREEQELQAELP